MRVSESVYGDSFHTTFFRTFVHNVMHIGFADREYSTARIFYVKTVYVFLQFIYYPDDIEAL